MQTLKLVDMKPSPTLSGELSSTIKNKQIDENEKLHIRGYLLPQETENNSTGNSTYLCKGNGERQTYGNTCQTLDSLICVIQLDFSSHINLYIFLIAPTNPFW